MVEVAPPSDDAALRRNGDDEALRTDVLVVEGMRAGYCGDLLSAADQEALEAVCARNLDTDPWFGGLLNNIQCYLHIRRGDVESARRCGLKALGYFVTASSPYGCVFIHIHLALTAIAQDRLSHASHHVQAGEALVIEHFFGNVSLLSILHTLRAQVAYARNDIAGAADLLSDSLASVSTSEGWPELYAGGYGTSVLLWLARGDSVAAEATLHAAADLLRARALPQLTLFLTALPRQSVWPDRPGGASARPFERGRSRHDGKSCRQLGPSGTSMPSSRHAWTSWRVCRILLWRGLTRW